MENEEIVNEFVYLISLIWESIYVASKQPKCRLMSKRR